MRTNYLKKGVKTIPIVHDPYFLAKCEYGNNGIYFLLADPVKRGGFEYFTAFLRYGSEFRESRRDISQYFNSREHVHLYPLFSQKLKILLKNLLDNPDNFLKHISR